MQGHVCVCTWLYMCVCMVVYVCVCMLVYVCVCLCVCVGQRTTLGTILTNVVHLFEARSFTGLELTDSTRLVS